MSVAITNGLGFFEDMTDAVERAVHMDIEGKAHSFVNVLRRALIENASLPDNFWDEIDDEVIRVAKEELQARMVFDANDLVQTGGDVGIQISKWADLNDFQQAVQSMSAQAESPDQRHDWNMNFVPVPFTHLDFTMDLRQLRGAEREGFSLDTTSVETATRRVAEKLEDTITNSGDVTLTINGTQQSLNGLTSYSDRVTGDLNDDWTSSGSRNIVGNDGGDIHDMINDMPDGYEGPFAVGVSSKYDGVLGQDYQSDGSRTFRERILQINSIESLEIYPQLAAGDVVMHQTTSNVADLRRIEGIQAVNWEVSPFTTRFKVFAVEAPRLKSDRNANTGIVHYTEP